MDGQRKNGVFEVLIVEDDSMLRSALVESARTLGMKVVESPDGFDAWTKIQNQVFEGMIIDMNLPRRPGHELVTMIRNGSRSNSSHCTIVVLSGYLKREIVEGLAGKVEKAFTKPADIEEVVQKLYDLMLEKRKKEAA